VTADDVYEVFAVKYATRDARRPEHFIGGDPHDEPMPMDYFVWAVLGQGSVWVVDTGFGSYDASQCMTVEQCSTTAIAHWHQGCPSTTSGGTPMGSRSFA
jgi:hypothetical protein